MLEAKPWRAEAVVRLFLSVLISYLLVGALGMLAVHCVMGATKPNTVLTLSVIVAAFASFAAALFLLGRPWTVESFVRNALLMMACIYVGLPLMWWAMHLRGNETETGYSTADMIVAVASFQGAALLWVVRFLREHGTSWSDAFGLGHQRTRALLLGGVVAIAVFVAIRLMYHGIQEVYDRLNMKSQEQLAVQVLRDAQGWANWLVLGIATLLVAPLAEELLFRGILYPALKRRGHPQLALWVTSLLFAAVHVNVAAFLPLTFLALILAWLYEKTGNLLAPMVVHSIFNTFNFALLCAQPWLEEKFPRVLRFF